MCFLSLQESKLRHQCLKQQCLVPQTKRLCGVAIRSPVCFFAALVLLHIPSGSASADCDSSREAAAILASDLADQADVVAEIKKTVAGLANRLESADENDIPKIQNQKNTADSNHKAARTNFQEIVRKITAMGREIKRSC